jgi:hypothetical protein
MNLNRVHPLLLEWAGHYVHLREVTADDVTAATGPLHGSLRRDPHRPALAVRPLQEGRHDLPRPHATWWRLPAVGMPVPMSRNWRIPAPAAR